MIVILLISSPMPFGGMSTWDQGMVAPDSLMMWCHQCLSAGCPLGTLEREQQGVLLPKRVTNAFRRDVHLGR